MAEAPFNNRVATQFVAKQLKEQLKDEYKNTHEEVILENLAMLFIIRKTFFSYLEFLRNIHTRSKYDERIDDQGSPQNFVHNLVMSMAFLYFYYIVGRDSGVDFGSISRFSRRNWGTSEAWRASIKPNEDQRIFITRAFDIRNKLIAHIDLGLERLIDNDDINNLVANFESYIIPTVSKIFEEFLGHNQAGNLDFQDLSIQTYRLLYPLHPEIKR